MQGHFSNNSADGIWLEFYENGHLLSEGMCQVLQIDITYLKNSRQPDKIKLIDQSDPKDTSNIPFTKNNYDSINNLTIYDPIHTKDKEKSTYKQPAKAIKGFPDALSIKTGEWKYYDEKGLLIRTEFYKNGILLQ